MIPMASELHEPEKENGDFPETIAFERYAVKTSEKAIITLGLPQTAPLALCKYLGDTGDCKHRIFIMKRTKVQTLGKLRMRSTTN